MKLARIALYSALSVMFLFGTSACKKDGDQPELPQPQINEPEQITTVELHFTSDMDEHLHVEWSDPDGPGGNEPEIDEINLTSGRTYEVEISFLDKSGESVQDLTTEIREEDEEHIVCFEPEGDVMDQLTITRTDSDGEFEIGLDSQWVVGEPATGEIHVQLKHQPGGVKDGTCSPGETDVDVHFDINITE